MYHQSVCLPSVNLSLSHLGKSFAWPSPQWTRQENLSPKKHWWNTWPPVFQVTGKGWCTFQMDAHSGWPGTLYGHFIPWLNSIGEKKKSLCQNQPVTFLSSAIKNQGISVTSKIICHLLIILHWHWGQETKSGSTKKSVKTTTIPFNFYSSTFLKYMSILIQCEFCFLPACFLFFLSYLPSFFFPSFDFLLFFWCHLSYFRREQFRKLNTLQILFEKFISMTVLKVWKDLAIIFIFLFFKAKTTYFFIVYYLRIKFWSLTEYY